MSILALTDATHIEEGKTFTFKLSFDCSLPVRWSLAPLREAQDAVLIDRPDRLDVLQRLDDYPHVRRLLDADCLDYAKQRKVQVRQW